MKFTRFLRKEKYKIENLEEYESEKEIKTPEKHPKTNKEKMKEKILLYLIGAGMIILVVVFSILQFVKHAIRFFKRFAHCRFVKFLIRHLKDNPLTRILDKLGVFKLCKKIKDAKPIEKSVHFMRRKISILLVKFQKKSQAQ